MKIYISSIKRFGKFYISFFQDVLKVTDFQWIPDQESLLMNLNWLLMKNCVSKENIENLPTLQSKVIKLLTKICEQVPSTRSFLRDDLGLIRSLTNLMTSLDMNMILELLRLVIHGITILRQESWIEKLVLQLIRYRVFHYRLFILYGLARTVYTFQGKIS